MKTIDARHTLYDKRSNTFVVLSELHFHRRSDHPDVISVVGYTTTNDFQLSEVTTDCDVYLFWYMTLELYWDKSAMDNRWRQLRA